jgi:hypothetical protein
MTKIKNKFIIFVIILLCLIVIWLFLHFYLEKNKNINSYAVLINWKAKLNNEYVLNNIINKINNL